VYIVKPIQKTALFFCGGLLQKSVNLFGLDEIFHGRHPNIPTGQGLTVNINRKVDGRS
jgi:hypothetical protein